MSRDNIYLSQFDKYIFSDGCMYTDNELDHFILWEWQWKQLQPKYTFAKIMEIFPEATVAARRGLDNYIKEYKKEINRINERQQEYYDKWIAPAHFTKQAEIKAEADIEFNDMRKYWEHKIKKAMFDLSHLDELEGKGKKITRGITEADIENAKQIPIETFYTEKLRKGSKIATGKCPFHNENTGSFMIYLDQNTFWCYGCNTGGSVIDFVMQQNRTDFLSAVKLLLKIK